MGLNEKQKQIVETVNGPVLVVACPGSGKTTAMVERAKNMVDHGISPKNILMITFTKEAASSMQKRYEKKYGDSGIRFNTIHSVCYDVLRDVYGYTSKDLFLETEKWNFFTRILYKKIPQSEMEDFVRTLIQEISYIKNKEMPPEEFTPQMAKKEDFAQLYALYENHKKSMKKIDFDDMLTLTKKIFQRDRLTLELYQDRYRYIMIDEYQDTNRVQADIFYMLAAKYRNICVVGDDDQSIYGFRSADSSIMLDFPKKFLDCKTIYLDTNYRSEPKIIELAGALIGNNRVRFAKKFLAHKDGQARLSQKGFVSGVEQKNAILRGIQMLRNEHVPENEIAILYRTNKQNLLYVHDLLKEDIPFYTTEAVRDIHDMFLFQDILSYYRLSKGIQERGDLLKVLNRPSRYLKSDAFLACAFDLEEMLSCCRRLDNPTSARSQVYDMWEDIQTLAGKRPHDFVKYLFFTMDYARTAYSYAKFCGKDESEIHEVLTLLEEESKEFDTMEEWIAYTKVYAKRLQEKKKQRKGICLSTYHSAKGLEWDNVFLIDCNEGITPYQKARTAEEIEEERRLFYVAFTRARKEVHLTYIDNGKRGGKFVPSRFVTELGLIDRNDWKMGQAQPKNPAYPPAQSYYAVKRGRTVGVFETWEECKRSTNGFPGAKFKKFESEKDAYAFVGRR
jgi:DNA helicase-2/ATP-dependent DNA helicase PcrA